MEWDKRIPPNQDYTEEFPILHEGRIPDFDRETWDFKIFGLVEEEVTLNYDGFMALPRRVVT